MVVIKEILSWSSSILQVLMDSIDNKYGVIDLRESRGWIMVIGSFVMGLMISGVLIGMEVISLSDDG